MRIRPQKETVPPLPWTFVIACTALLILGNALLATYHHQQHKRIILTTSETLFAGIAQRVQSNLSSLHRGPGQMLSVLAHDPIDQANTLDRRLAYLDKLAQILIELPHLDSVYIGWPNGDLMLVRPLLESGLRERFDAPEAATWMVWHIGSLGGQREWEHRFYNDSMRLIKARQVNAGHFDPRERDWYRLAVQSPRPVITPPYVFHSTSEFGVSVALPAGGGVVLGADITLQRLSASLAGHGLTPSSELLLYDAQGTVVAYKDARRIKSPAHGSALHLPGFHELGSTLIARLAEDGYEVERQTSLSLEGQRWLVLQQRLNLPNLPDIFLAILVPEGELLETARGFHQRSLLIGLLGSLLLLSLFWLIARLTLNRRL